MKVFIAVGAVTALLAAPGIADAKLSQARAESALDRYVKQTYSSIIDSDMTMAMGNLAKVFSWYDNEAGYSNRLVDLALIVGAANQ